MKPTSAILFLMASLSVASQPLDLATALREASSQGRQALLVEEAHIRSNAQIEEVRSVAWPQVGLYANAGRGRSPQDASAFARLIGGGGGAMPAVIGSEQSRFSYGVEVQQPIFTFGKVSTALRMASVFRNTAREQRRMGLQQLQSAALDAWYGAWIAEVHAGSFDRSEARLAEMEARLLRDFEAGAGARAQILQTKAARLGVAGQKLSARIQATDARRRLNLLLGRPLLDSVPLDTASALPDQVEGASADAAQMVTAASDNRPDLALLEKTAEFQEHTTTIYRANYLPTIAAMAKVGILAYRTDQLGDWDNREWQIGVGLTWTIFDGFRNAGLAGQSRSDARSTRLRLAEAREALDHEVLMAMERRRNADSILAAAQAGHRAAAEARDLLERDWRAGGGILADVLAAEEALRLSEVALVSARHTRAQAQAGLALVQGIDLVPLPEAP